MDVAYDASETLLKQLLGRIVPPSRCGELLQQLREGGKLSIDFSSLEFLSLDEIDIGTDARIELAKLGDDTEPSEIKGYVQSCVEWIISFITKMLKALPFKEMLLYSYLNPATLGERKISDCKLW